MRVEKVEAPLISTVRLFIFDKSPFSASVWFPGSSDSLKMSPAVAVVAIKRHAACSGNAEGAEEESLVTVQL
jgi:hypothetical protein